MNDIVRDKTPKLAEALAKANLEIHNPGFDKENPHFRSKFASLAAVRNALVPIYAKHGLSVLQDLQSTDDSVLCFTTLLHLSGEERTYGPLKVKAAKLDGQGIAAAGTYAKRIHLQAVSCVVGDDDDDGETAAGRPETGSTDIPRGTNPHGQKWTGKDTKAANDYAKRITEAVNEGRDVLELWDEAKTGGEAFATAVWTGLSKAIKDLIRDEDDKRKRTAA